MLGFYQNFPREVHNILHFSVSASPRRLQQTLTQTLCELNTEAFSIEDVAYPSVPQCKVLLEFGIAEANVFNYLDKEETHRTLKIVHKKPFQIMDFFCVIRYYKKHVRKESPLKFDYYMLRFAFDRKLAEVQVFHEKGPRHVLPEEIVGFIAKKINEHSSRRLLKEIAAF